MEIISLDTISHKVIYCDYFFKFPKTEFDFAFFALNANANILNILLSLPQEPFDSCGTKRPNATYVTAMSYHTFYALFMLVLSTLK